MVSSMATTVVVVSAEADELDVTLLDGLEYLLWIDVAAKVKDGVAVVVEQHFDDVLANIVDVALDGGHADLTLVGNLAGGHQAFDGIEAHARGLGPAMSCGKKNLPWSKRTPTSSRAGIK